MRIRSIPSYMSALLLVTGIIVGGTSCSTTQLGPPTATEVVRQPAEVPVQPTEIPGQPTPTFSPSIEVVATNLQVPWALAFAPDGRLFFTERPGRLRVIVGGQVQPEPVAKLPATEVGESGLMGLALDPAFQGNGYLYVMYTYSGGAGGLKNRVSRLTESQGKASDEKVLLDNLPAGTIHDGGRIKFGPDGKLYITQGETGNTALAQQIDSPAGKVLRINPDGSIPADNPFPGSPVYSLGHRNPEGLAWHPGTGQLFISEHGPVGRDEINIVKAGGNYGWPEVSGSGGAPRFIDPIQVYSPAVAPTGATFYSGGKLLPWQNSLFVTTLQGRCLLRITLQSPGFQSVETQERLFENQFGRLRDVVQGPDGYLYFSTSNRDGRGTPAASDDRILRIVPR